MDNETLRAAVASHREDIKSREEKCFSRRRVILIADMAGARPMSMVWRMEKMGLLSRGSYDWFKDNGGITAEHVKEARAGVSVPLATK